MNLDKLKKEIDKAFSIYDYKKTVELVKEYFQLKEQIDLLILFKYVIALKKLNYPKEEIKPFLEYIYKYEPNFYFKLSMGILYHNHGLYEEAKETFVILAKMNKKSSMVYSYLGKTCYELNEYNNAKTCLNLALSCNPKPKTKEICEWLLKKINLYLERDKFVEVSYEEFTKKGREVSSGLIVNLKNNKPYLIYKVKENNCYSFPLTKELNKNTHHLICSSNRGGIGAYLDGEIVKFNKEDINYIISAMYTSDLKYALINMARYYSKVGISALSTLEKEFMDEIKNNVEINDIVAIYNNNLGKDSYYFVLNITEDRIEAMKAELINGVFTLTQDSEFFPKDVFVTEIVSLPASAKNKLISESKKDNLVLKREK